MKKYVKQFRYYAEPNNNGESGNEPKGLDRVSLVKGSAFSNFTPIVHLGIQTLPGVKFYLNKSNEGTIIGNSGLFELDLEEQVQITALSFNNNSITQINESPTGYLIIDIIYEREDD